jgi:hypothetical protein
MSSMAENVNILAAPVVPTHTKSDGGKLDRCISKEGMCQVIRWSRLQPYRVVCYPSLNA